MLTHEQRLVWFDAVTNSLDVFANGDKLCIHNENLGDAIQMGNRFGTPSEYGEAWVGYHFADNYKVAIKKIPLDNMSDRMASFTRDQMRSGKSAWTEIAAYLLCTVLVFAKVCPNLPVMYKYFWCPTCSFMIKKQKRGQKKRKKRQRPLTTTKPCLLVVNEMANADLKFYLEKTPQIFTAALQINCVFQMVAGLYTLEKFYNMTHNDLHYGNILLHEIPRGGYWHYRIDGKNYYVPNLGYVFVLWDLGMAHIPRKMKGRREFGTDAFFPLQDKYEDDIGRICSIMLEVLEEQGIRVHKILKDVVRNEGIQTLKSIIQQYFKSYQTPRDNILDFFNMDISLESIKAAHPPQMRWFLR
jgi:hypothetical protein